MTIAPKPAFPPLDADAFDQRLDARAAAKGIPTLTKPGPLVANTESGVMIESGAQAETADDMGVEPASEVEHTHEKPRSPSARRSTRKLVLPPKAPDAGPTPRARMKPLNVELPDYVWIELKHRAAREMVSVRHVIMTLLNDAGIAIAEPDMIEDGRRLR